MKKFEEELNNGLVSIGQNIITKEYAYGKGALINYFKDWVSPEDHQAEIEKLKAQLEKQQPEIPEFVATEIERLKSEGIKTLCDFYNCDVDWMTFGMEDLRGDELAVAKWFYHNTETFELAYSYGYTVAKEKRFYLALPTKFFVNFKKTMYVKDDPEQAFTLHKHFAKQFTQSEIDSMETGSYEQIEVEE